MTTYPDEEQQRQDGHNGVEPMMRDLAIIFDGNRRVAAMGVIRSALKAPPTRFHLVTELASASYWETLFGASQHEHVLYDVQQCHGLVRDVLPFAPSIHYAVHCKLFLAHVLPAEVSTVLLVDSDTVLVGTQLQTACMPPFRASAYIGMVLDMGDACQLRSHKCWPLPFEGDVPPGTVCGTSPKRAEVLFQAARPPEITCVQPGQRQPLQVNGGVMYMNLTAMRANNFTERYVDTVWHTARMMPPEHMLASWGEQEFINNFFRFFPEAVQMLPCGCNYQYVASRRELVCPGQPVHLAHAWGIGLKKENHHPLSDFMRTLWNSSSSLSLALRTLYVKRHWSGFSDVEPMLINLTTPFLIPVRDCPHQRWNCMEDLRDGILRHTTVNILTRTAGRPGYFWHSRRSVAAQTHRHVRHIVATDTPEYVSADVVLTVPTPLPFGDVACEACGATKESSCSHPPKGSNYTAFLNCYCSTPYPPNALMRTMYAHLTPGYVIYLDDDKRLADEFVLTRLLVKMHTDEIFVLWRATTGRIVPKDKTFEKCAVVQGDVDAGNLVFHSSLHQHADWTDRRCGDHRAASSLAKVATPTCHDVLGIVSHPINDRNGGGGRRADLPQLTVITTLASVGGLRTSWVETTLRSYLSDDYRYLVDRTLLVWNTPQPPGSNWERLAVEASGRFKLLPMSNSSLNNRWMATLPHVRTEMVLNLDDDIALLKPGIECLMATALTHPRSVLGPFVRTALGQLNGDFHTIRYSLDELADRNFTEGLPAYLFSLPRVMLLSRSHMEVYSRLPSRLHQYVDDEPAHSDDILFGLANRPHYRVLLPTGSVVDFDSTCRRALPKDRWRGLIGGLGLGINRGKTRSMALQTLLRALRSNVSRSRAVGACSELTGQPRSVSNFETYPLFVNMEAQPLGPALETPGLCLPGERGRLLSDLFAPLEEKKRKNTWPSAAILPTLKASETCPPRRDLENTPVTARARLWNDTTCADGCRLVASAPPLMELDGAVSCVKRARAEFLRPCHRLPYGCSTRDKERYDHVRDEGAIGSLGTVFSSMLFGTATTATADGDETAAARPANAIANLDARLSAAQAKAKQAEAEAAAAGDLGVLGGLESLLPMDLLPGGEEARQAEEADDPANAITDLETRLSAAQAKAEEDAEVSAAAASAMDNLVPTVFLPSGKETHRGVEAGGHDDWRAPAVPGKRQLPGHIGAHVEANFDISFAFWWHMGLMLLLAGMVTSRMRLCVCGSGLPRTRRRLSATHAKIEKL